MKWTDKEGEEPLIVSEQDALLAVESFVAWVIIAGIALIWI